MVRIRNMVLILAVALLLCGCNIQPASELYCLPERAADDSNLSEVIRDAMAGLEYCAPLDGKHCQSVQQAQLNGDEQMEYLVYAKNTEDQGLRILIFGSNGKEYRLLDTVECAGSDFDCVEYVPMDNASGCEIVVGRRSGDGTSRSVTVYSLIVDHAEPFLSTNYSQFLATDLDDNGLYELLVIRAGSVVNAVAQMYYMNERVMESTHQTLLSVPAEQIRRVFSSRLMGDEPAVYVESALLGSQGLITDVLDLQEDRLQNVTISPESMTSESTMREHPVFAVDMDGDGIPELPRLLESRNPTDQYAIQWYCVDGNGDARVKISTYHNFNSGWYLELDNALAPRITVTQKGGSFEFSLWNNDFTESEKLMTVFVLTGQRREEQAVSSNRFVLTRTDTTVYAASLEIASSKYGMSQQGLIGSFHLIRDEAITGVN